MSDKIILTYIKNKDEKYQKKEETILDIILSVRDSGNDSKINYRISISGLEKINEYMSMLHLRKNHLVFGVLVNFIMDKNIDPKDKNTLRIDLWTEDMTVDEMKQFFHQTLLTMADSFERATNERNICEDLRDYCYHFADKMNILPQE